ncbi:hypothetical protein CGRA01v4_06671 [Colletotrichum graminicola]|nr:hypothetical protein CGRA01v4_06671 [Colletotrichum graminicola]
MPLFWVASFNHFSGEPAQLHRGRYLVLACALVRSDLQLRDGRHDDPPLLWRQASISENNQALCPLQVLVVPASQQPLPGQSGPCYRSPVCAQVLAKTTRARYEPKGMVVLSIDMSWRMVAQPLGIRSSAPPQKSEAGVTAHRTYMDGCNQGWQTYKMLINNAICIAMAMAIYVAAGCRQAGQYGYKIVVSA